MAGPSKSRRDSVIDGCNRLQIEFKNRLEQLRSIWVEVGVSPEVFEERQNMVYEHLINLMDEMVEEESEMKRIIGSTISQLLKIFELLLDSAVDIRQHFSAKLPSLDDPLLDQEGSLKTQVKEICYTIFCRLGQFMDLRDQDAKLSLVLGVSEFDGLKSFGYVEMKKLALALESYQSSLEDTTTVPDTELFDLEIKAPVSAELTYFERYVKDKLEDKNCKIKKYSNLHNDCSILIKKLRRARLEPKPEIIELIDVSPDHVEETKNLHEDRLDILNNAFKELRDRYIIFKESLGMRIKDSHDELMGLLNKTGASEREFADWLTVSDDDDLNEELLDRYERKIVALRMQYDSNKAIYDKINELSDTFDKIQSMKKQQHDSSFYTKFVGLKLKHFLSDLTHSEKDYTLKKDVLCRLIEVYDSTHQSTPFYFCGDPVINYIVNREDHFKLLEEQEKAEKKAQRERKIEKEAMYGTSPRPAPSKRPGGLMVGSSPCKLRNSGIDVTGSPGRNTTASSSSRYMHSSIQKCVTRSPMGRAGRPPLPPKNNAPAELPVASHRHIVHASKPVRGAVADVSDDVTGDVIQSLIEPDQIESYDEFQNHIHDNQDMHSSVLRSNLK